MAPAVISTESQKDNHTTTTNITTATETTETAKVNETTKSVANNNDLYNDYNYSQLLNVTKNETQKEASTYVSYILYDYSYNKVLKEFKNNG